MVSSLILMILCTRMSIVEVAPVLVLCACAPRPTPAPESPSGATKVEAPQQQPDAGPAPAPVVDAGTRLSLLRHDRADTGASADNGAAASQPQLLQLRSTGVPACDYYLQRYAVCTRDKIPAASRALTERALLSMSEAWRKAAATPGGRKALATACKTALQTAKKAMAAFKCQW